MKKLSASLEDYLEAIWHLARGTGSARSKDIADRLGVNKSSVTGALKNLAGRGLIHYEAYQNITLTESGRKAASEIARRHEILRDFLTRILQVNPELAEANACRMEHDLDGKVIEKLIQFVEFVQSCPRTQSGWIEGFQKLCTRGLDRTRCVDCLQSCRDDLDRALERSRSPDKGDIPLTELQPGERARIVSLESEDMVPGDLQGKGLTPGALVHIDRIQDRTDQLRIHVRGYQLSLALDFARSILVHRLKD